MPVGLSKSIPGLRIDCLGDCGPFSRIGDSIGYRLSYQGAEFLIDCGFPLFKKLGLGGVGRIRGILVTHSHDDHRRWLTDFALFRYYAPLGVGRPLLLGTEDVQTEAEAMSRPALQKTLSADSRTVISVAYENFFDARPIGPRPLYRMIEDGRTWRIVDREGTVLPPSRAKVVINPRDTRSAPRMLYRDGPTGLWVDPELYYSYEETEFYDVDQRSYTDPTGLVLRAVKATSWHGMATTSVLVETPDEQVLFSSDTVYDPDLWEDLARERRTGRAPPESASTLTADINDFIEATWSRNRLDRARRYLEETPVVLHDVAARASVVHTDYHNLSRGRWRRLFLVHSPDRFVSRYPLGRVSPSIRVVGTDFFEQVGDRLYTPGAAVYVRDLDKCYVGFRNDAGAFEVIDDKGLLDIAPAGAGRNLVFRIDLYRVISGGYYPVDPSSVRDLRVRPDGAVEEISWTIDGSSGRRLVDRRPKLEPSQLVADL